MGVVIGVFSAKGGVGKTLLATNLGVALGLGQQKKSVVIDLNPGFGTADLLLDLDPDRSWEDLLPVIHELTLNHIELAVTEFRPGIDLLACSPQFSRCYSLGKNEISALLSTLSSRYRFILLDTPPAGGKINKICSGLCDVRLVVLTPDAPALRATERYLKSLTQGEKMTGLVVNQFSPGAAVNPDEIQSHLQTPLFGVLPMDPESVWANVSYGEPCVLHKNSQLGKSIRHLSTMFIK